MSIPPTHPTAAFISARDDLAFTGVARLSGLPRAGEVTPRELVEL